MTFTKKLIGFTVVNTLVFYVGHLAAPDVVVFGNIIIPFWQAIVTAAFGVTLAHILFEPIAEEVKFVFHKHNWLTVFFLVNTATIYILARSPLSKSVGFGIVGFWVAFVLGIVVTAAQYAFWKWTMKK